MSKITNVKRIYWEEDMPHGDMQMVFELEDGRKMELAVYGGETGMQGDSVLTDVIWQELPREENSKPNDQSGIIKL